MIYSIALSSEERTYIRDVLFERGKTGTAMDKQVNEAFVRGSIDNTQGPTTKWSRDAIDGRYKRYGNEMVGDYHDC